MKRLSVIIKYYEETDLHSDEKRDEFIKQCSDNYQGANLLDDVYHLQRKHSDQYVQIKNEMSLQSCKLSEINEQACLAISRYYDEGRKDIGRTKEQFETDVKYEIYINIMDNVHNVASFD